MAVFRSIFRRETETSRTVRLASRQGRRNETTDRNGIITSGSRLHPVQPRDIDHIHHLRKKLLQRILPAKNARHRHAIGFGDEEVVGQHR